MNNEMIERNPDSSDRWLWGSDPWQYRDEIIDTIMKTIEAKKRIEVLESEIEVLTIQCRTLRGNE